MTKISILGCGWLGLPLAKALLKNDYLVNGSTTSEGKLAVLENAGIKPFLIVLSENKTIGELSELLKNSETLIIDVPPKLRGSGAENFVSKIRNIIPIIENSSVKKVLFISSSSVYGDTDTLVSEETPPKPDTESGKQLLETEQLLQSAVNFQTTILRFGGLIGEDRHPIHFLAGRENLDNPDAPINLIHQEDCIGIILKIIELNIWNETFNAVTPCYPSREMYYTQKAEDLNLALPKFTHENPSVGKTILSTKIKTVLNYTFTKPNL
ncbi:SDR family oxidoreductase [Flavobacterium sp. LB2R40]|uniref:SDR family oxidoreductase n=1 Tax=Flavobacterium sp. LB2R40 TaxID=3401722 RepID=UPI003AAB15A9